MNFLVDFILHILPPRTDHFSNVINFVFVPPLSRTSTRLSPDAKENTTHLSILLFAHKRWTLFNLISISSQAMWIHTLFSRKNNILIFLPMLMQLRNYPESQQYTEHKYLQVIIKICLLWFIGKHFFPKPRKTLMSSVGIKCPLEILEAVLSEELGYWIRSSFHRQTWCKYLPQSKCYIYFAWIYLDGIGFKSGVFLVK